MEIGQQLESTGVFPLAPSTQASVYFRLTKGGPDTKLFSTHVLTSLYHQKKLILELKQSLENRGLKANK